MTVPGPRRIARRSHFSRGDERVPAQLQNVLKALRHAGISVVAIHQHMTGESPRVMFLHYWGVGRAEDLAKGLAAALKETRS